ncbi:MAG: MFS transporter [Geminicoccaceae bacterium]
MTGLAEETTAQTAPVDERAERTRRTLVLLTVSLCTMLYSLTVTIVNVTLPQLQGALSATPDQVAWVVTLNLVATAVVTPMTGWLVGRFGRRPVMIWSVFGFALSSLLCATATSLAPLLVYRIGQGAFGAPLVPLSQALIVATYPEKDRAMAQGFFGMSVVLGPAIGPVFGGYLAEAYSWRWVFILIVPLSLAALIMVLAFIRDGDRKADARLDWTGFLALSIAVASLQLLMDRGERGCGRAKE